ncbi:MAG TPA: endolytic transglycosylase MltG, partial [Burkholderiales bacterium]|nr:endolytic transglycosylase MltG [Burkholderiales bacterium]
MLKSLKRFFKRLLSLVALVGAAFVVWLAAYGWLETNVPAPVQFSLKEGSSLRSAARQMHAAGVLNSPRQFEVLARVKGNATRVQAGNYEISGATSPVKLLQMITSGVRGQDKLTLVEGWTFAQLRAALDEHPALKHDTRGKPEAELAMRLGITQSSAEGWFMPDTYFFPNGASDFALLQRATVAMRAQLETLWAARADGVPLANSYEALILASIVEKETGQPAERPQIAAVFENRLKLGMKLQTDPTVIYGLGQQFDGNLRKRDLLADGPYNTYTREGLPPTPIALPGLASLMATVKP